VSATYEEELPMLADRPEVAEPLFQLHTSACGTTLTIVCAGEFDLAVDDAFSAAVDSAIGSAPETILIDLSGLAFIDSTGIQALLRAHRRAQSRGVRLVIIPAPERVHRVFRVCRLDGALPFVSTASAPG
jgi:anti-sigma B factor antagonist